MEKMSLRDEDNQIKREYVAKLRSREMEQIRAQREKRKGLAKVLRGYAEWIRSCGELDLNAINADPALRNVAGQIAQHQESCVRQLEGLIKEAAGADESFDVNAEMGKAQAVLGSFEKLTDAVIKLLGDMKRDVARYEKKAKERQPETGSGNDAQGERQPETEQGDDAQEERRAQMESLYDEYLTECFDLESEVTPLEDFSFPSEIGFAIESVRADREKKLADEYIKKQIDELMAVRYDYIRSDEMLRTGSQEVSFGAADSGVTVFVTGQENLSIRILQKLFDRGVILEDK